MKTGRSIKRRFQTKFQAKTVPQFGLLGNYSHVVEVPNRPNFVYVRFAGQVLSEVFNDRVAPLEDLEVLVGYDPEEPNLYQVLDIRSNLKRYAEDDEITAYLPEHHKTHEWMNFPGGGNDVVFVDLRQFMPLRVTPMETGVGLSIHRGVMYGEGNWVYVTGGIVDMSPYVPVTGARFALLSLGLDGLPDITIGAIKDTATLLFTDVPSPNPGTVPLSITRLYGGQTRIYEAFSSTDIADTRFPGATSFLNLFDTEYGYTGSAGMAVFVNDSETGLIFSTVSGDGGGGGGTGTFTNPMVYKGDMIYSDAGGVVGTNLADINYGATATGSSVYSPIYTPANYVLRWGTGYNNETDGWANNVWTSDGGLGYYFHTAYVTIGFTGTATLQGWSLRHSITANPTVKAGQYEVASWNTGTSSWDVQATHSPTSLEEYIDFATPVTTQFVRFRGIVNEDGLTTGKSWSIQNIGLYEYGTGQKPTRLPYGSAGQILAVEDIGGSTPRFHWLEGDITGTYDAIKVQGIVNKGIYGSPIGGEVLQFSEANDRWELVSGGVGGGGGASNFLGLTDTPSSYSGKGTYFVKVNSGATGLEFSSGSVSGADITKWYSPLDYGGVGDGIADDSGAISGTIAAIPASGGVLYFPAGYTWKTGGGHKLNKPVLVKGMGNANSFNAHYGISTIICTSGSARLFEVNSFGCSFEDIFLMGQTGTTPTAGAGITVVDGGDLMHFSNVTTHSFFIGMDIQDGFAWHMDHCFFVNTAKYGVKIQHIGFVDGGDQFIDNCIFWADGRTSDAAIRLESGGGLKIDNTKIVGSGQSDKQYHYGLDVYLGDNVQTSVIFVNDTSIENVDTNGIRVVTSATGSSVLYAVMLSGIEIAVEDKGVGSSSIYMSNQVTGTLGWVTINNILCFDWQKTITDEAVYLDGVAHARIGTILRDGFGGDLATPNCIDVIYATGTSGGVSAFTGLTDTPSSYVGQAGRYVKVNPGATGLEFSTSTGSVGAIVFTDLGDVPSSYSGEGSKLVAVNSGATALEFISPSLLTGTFSGAKAFNNIDFIVTGSAIILVPFNSEYYDTDGYHITGSTVSNNSRLTIPANGYYEIGVQLKWNDSTTGIRELYLKRDGTTYIGVSARQAPSAGTVFQNFVVQDYFTGSSYVQLEATHNVGSSQTIVYADRYAPQIWINKL